MMRGYLMLTEGRSGSNWLGSLANSTQRMGHLEEWIDSHYLETPLEGLSLDRFVERFLQKASTPNARFAIKIFPRHLYLAHHLFGVDIIKELSERYETAIILLERADRFRQAISFAKGRMTGQWRSTQTARAVARYNFDEICIAYFYIERSYAYWQSYVQLKGLAASKFTYEALVGNPTPYVTHLAELLDVDVPSRTETELSVQRDTETEEWLSRFREELAEKDIVGLSSLHRAPGRNLENLHRYFKKEPMKPLPLHL